MRRSLLAPAGVPPKAARLVADVLTERIVEGEYVPGDLLPSADELIAEFGISRPTLREALNRLESAGFVSLRRILPVPKAQQKWAREDLNLRPHAYQACALTN